ncbi:MAG: metallophosphoesterase [Candidatus Thermoplasmatota archaeon]
MKCIFVTDIHGNIRKYNLLFKIISKEKPDVVFIGGDLFPLQLKKFDNLNEFIEKVIINPIKKIKKENQTRFFIIMGNDDPRKYEKKIIKSDQEEIIDYINKKKIKYQNYHIIGYPYIPPSPFRLKDWEKYDVSRHMDVGAISPEKGVRTVDVSDDEIRFSTISKDLGKISENLDFKKSIFLFHSPPYKTNLDRADLDGKMIDHAPLDVHVGSIAIKRFIKKNQPFLTLHGHVHESTKITGKWKQRIGKTLSVNGAHEGNELCVTRFDTSDISKVTRKLYSIS